jgi:alpha-mannosidase
MTDSSELKKLLADELKRRREFSERLLKMFHRSDLEGAKEVEMLQEMQKLDKVVYNMVEELSLKESAEVNRRQKGM